MPPKRRHRLSHLFSKLDIGEGLIIRRREPTPRDPTPLDPTRPSIAQLPEHIVRRILAWLHDVRPDTVRTVASLSTSLYQLARSVQHTEVHVDLDKSRYVLDRLDLIQRLDQLTAVRILRVNGRGCNNGQEGDGSTQILARLAALLPSMTGLRHLHWHVGSTIRLPWSDALKRTAVPIPAAILAALPRESRLHAAVFCTETREEHILAAHLQVRTFLQRLAACQNLCTLDIQITFIEEEHCLRTMRELKKVLLSCPNLTRLPRIDVWYPRGGCFAYGPPMGGGLYCGLGFSNGERPQPLTVLGVDYYPWGIEGVPSYQGYPAGSSKYEWDYWIDCFDWSRLERLHDIRSHLTLRIASKLTNLRELVLEEQACPLEAEFEDDITAPLELISLAGWHHVNRKPEFFSRFGATLRELKLHGPEPRWESENHAYITVADLVHLSKSLLLLEHLRLDILRDEETQDWPYKALDAIATFPNLRTVELWFPLGRAAPAPKPQLTVSSVPCLLRYLHERNKNIMRATLHSGDPSPPGGFAVAILPSNAWAWDMHSTISFVCVMVYDSDRPNEQSGSVDVWCPELSIEMNDKLHQLAQQTDRKHTNAKKLDEAELRLRVALDGPLNAENWGAWKQVQMRESWEREKKQQRRAAMNKFIPSLKRMLER
ncbi:hypothetical protein BGZ61DRAFT_536937 [Ilyonectria robusta]|uniref:uncharacterized protein n=1 Tax=Ilyonectria robusta TaxID=1079257 RepID=UPI001E8ECE16|nr:uncharacterized protein BGZ61DRAFT_536937 [Ilyonectria robusta]KAH8672291.1 hypothetical protein BGZ61DRAFT_536937 [Ilyonectria robusta]